MVLDVSDSDSAEIKHVIIIVFRELEFDWNIKSLSFKRDLFRVLFNSKRLRVLDFKNNDVIKLDLLDRREGDFNSRLLRGLEVTWGVIENELVWKFDAVERRDLPLYRNHTVILEADLFFAVLV